MPTERTSQGEANRNKDKLEGWSKDKDAEKFGNQDFSSDNEPREPYDPSHQNQGIDPGKPSNPNTPTPRNMDQDEGNLHTVVVEDDRLKASGKHTGGLPNQPIVTLNPTSKPVGSQKRTEPKQIADAQSYMLGKDEFSSPYDFVGMEVGSGLLIAVDPAKTIDQTILEAQKEVKRLNEYYSIPEVNDEGEEISNQIIVHEFKRNGDKTIQLGADNKPITQDTHGFKKRRIPLRLYAVKSVTADDEEISSDGALIVRVL